MKLFSSTFFRNCSRLLITAAVLISSADTFAQGIRIIDCRGNTRALRSEISSADSTVEVDVLDKTGQLASNGRLKLINAQNEVITAEIKKGAVFFPKVSPGVWMITSEQPDIFFTSISLSDTIPPPFWERTGSFLGDVGKAALVTGALVGAAVLVDKASDGDSGGDSSVVPPPAMDCPACDPDLAAPSIPAFQ